MKRYRVVITANSQEIGHSYDTLKKAEKVYNNIRALLQRLGYILVDAGGTDIAHGICELWAKDGFASRNIEIYPV